MEQGSDGTPRQLVSDPKNLWNTFDGTPVSKIPLAVFYIQLMPVLKKLDIIFLYQSISNKLPTPLQSTTIILSDIISLIVMGTEFGEFNFAVKLI